MFLPIIGCERKVTGNHPRVDKPVVPALGQRTSFHQKRNCSIAEGVIDILLC